MYYCSNQITTIGARIERGYNMVYDMAFGYALGVRLMVGGGVEMCCRWIDKWSSLSARGYMAHCQRVKLLVPHMAAAISRS